MLRHLSNSGGYVFSNPVVFLRRHCGQELCLHHVQSEQLFIRIIFLSCANGQSMLCIENHSVDELLYIGRELVEPLLMKLLPQQHGCQRTDGVGISGIPQGNTLLLGRISHYMRDTNGIPLVSAFNPKHS